MVFFPKYRADVDGLRAIAVIFVVAFHAFPEILQSGFIGVDIFFVISGFLISTLLFDGAISFKEFYSRRIRRLFPALLLVLSSCLVWGWLASTADEYKELGKHVAGGLGFVSNFVLWKEVGYFALTSELKPLLHLWSIGIEEQFYLLWPFLVWVASKKRIKFLTLVLIFVTVSFLFNIGEIYKDHALTFYLPHTRLWELLVGAILASSSGIQRLPKNFQSVLGILLIGLSLVVINKETVYPGFWALLPTMGAMFIISSGPESWFNQKILSHRFLVWIGLISFPLYLWHWPLLTFARIWQRGIPSPEIRWLIVGVSFALAWLTYQFIEMPIRRKDNNKTTLYLLALSMVVGCIGYFIFLREGSGTETAWKYNKNDICLQRYPFPEAQDYGWWHCIQNKDAEPTIVILGHSYANQYYPGFAANPELSHHSVLNIGTCDIGMSERTSLDGTHPCFGKRLLNQMTLIDSILKTKSHKYVILAGLAAIPNEAYIARVKKRIDAIKRNNVRVIIFTPHIESSFDPKECSLGPLGRKAKDCTFPVSVKEKQLQNFRPLMNAVSQTYPDILFFDPNGMFCRGETCSFLYEGALLLRDDGHLSELGSTLVQSYFSAWAKVTIPEILKP